MSEGVAQKIARLPDTEWKLASSQLLPAFAAMLRTPPEETETSPSTAFWHRADREVQHGGMRTQRRFVQRFDGAVQAALQTYWDVARKATGRGAGI